MMLMPPKEAREVTCVWCGYQFASTLQSQAEHLYEHAKICEKHPVRKLASENAQLREECSRLRSLASKQADEIGKLNSLADAVEVLRDIGRITGCGHVDDPDGRRKLANCVEQTIDDLREALVPFAAAAGRPGRLLDCIDRPLSDDAVLGLGVKVSAWKRAMELTGIIEKGN